MATRLRAGSAAIKRAVSGAIDEFDEFGEAAEKAVSSTIEELGEATHLTEISDWLLDKDGEDRADPSDALQRIPKLRNKMETSYGVVEQKEPWSRKLHPCYILRKLKCHLNNNLYSVKPQPQWSWQRTPEEQYKEESTLHAGCRCCPRARNIGCADEWEERYGSLVGLMCSLAVMGLVGYMAVFWFLEFLAESEVFVGATFRPLTMPSGGSISAYSPHKLDLPRVATWFRDYNNTLRYDERYMKVDFMSRTIHSSDFFDPRNKDVHYNTTLCHHHHSPDTIHESEADPLLSLCPGLGGPAVEIQGDYSDVKFDFFQVKWRRCSATDLGPKLVVEPDGSSYSVDAPCAPAEEADDWVFGGSGATVSVSVANASTPNFKKSFEGSNADNQDDWRRYATFTKGLRGSYDVFLTKIEVTTKSKWTAFGDLFDIPEDNYTKTFVDHMLPYIQNFVPNEGAVYSSHYFRCSDKAQYVRRTPQPLSAVLSKIGGLAQALQLLVGVGAIWFTKRAFDRKPRDIYHMGSHMGHRLNFPTVSMPAEMLDRGLNDPRNACINNPNCNTNPGHEQECEEKPRESWIWRSQ